MWPRVDQDPTGFTRDADVNGHVVDAHERALIDLIWPRDGVGRVSSLALAAVVPSHSAAT